MTRPHGGQDAVAGQSPAGTPEVPSLPACCIPSDRADLAEQLYCAWARAGATPGLYCGGPILPWSDLRADDRVRWRAVADLTCDLVREGIDLADTVPVAVDDDDPTTTGVPWRDA
jgi:hypothetical protein